MRLFIALDLSEEVRARVAEAVARESATVDARWVRTDALHLTVVFFGEVQTSGSAEVIATATRVARAHRPMRLQIKGSGTFPHVLWLAVRGDLEPLTALAAQLSQELGVVRDHPEFVPHLTIARAQHQTGDPMLDVVAQRLRRRDFGTWEVDHLTVYESLAGRYRALASLPLGS